MEQKGLQSRFTLVIETRGVPQTPKRKPRRKRHRCLHVHSYADLRWLTVNQVKRWFAQIEQETTIYRSKLPMRSAFLSSNPFPMVLNLFFLGSFRVGISVLICNFVGIPY